MLEAEMYRKLANDCIDRARQVRDDDAAAGIIRLAQFWMSKADNIERKFMRGGYDHRQHAARFERDVSPSPFNTPSRPARFQHNV